MTQNPFNISFGTEPLQNLSRSDTEQGIIETFCNPNPETESYILTGPRGCGKTVLLSQIKRAFERKNDWIAVDLNPCMEMHEQLAARIYESGKMKKLFLKTEFSFSFHGLSFSMSGDERVSDVYSLLKRMFTYLQKKNIKVFVTIDDISKNEYVKAFAHSFQSFLREGYKIFFVATGIYNNVASLNSDKALTFLLRTPKILVDPFSIRAVALSYKEIFHLPLEKAVGLAKLTNGYAFAYQLLGSLLFKNQVTEVNEKILDEYDLILEDRVYSQIWKELTNRERQIVTVLCQNEGISNVEIARKLQISPNALEVYKKSLVFGGILATIERGKLGLLLPRFKEFVLFKTII